jgi:predicted nuclease with TOPRIM domain
VLGEALVHVGEAQQTVGHSTIELVVKLRQNFYENLERANTEILEYKALRKKLEHRRVEYDSKLNKVQKAKKESPELEEDMREARVKYDECLKDTEAKMQQVMEGDDVLMRDLASYVDAHVEYFRKGLEVFERVGQEIASSYVILIGRDVE